MFKRACFTFAVCVALSACASLPESVTNRDAVATLSVPEGFSGERTHRSPIVGGLLELFQDATLETLVGRALAHNFDLQLAAKQLEEAGFNASAQKGEIFPNLMGGVSGDRAKAAKESPGSTFSPALDVAWEVDLWGKLSDRQASLEALTQARKENLQAVRDSIIAQVMQGWFDVVTAENQVALERARLDNFQKIAANNRRSFQAGLASLDDLTVIARDIAQTKAVYSQRLDNRNSAIRTLQVLMGSYPGGKMVGQFDLPELLPPPKAGLPASLLTKRPDLRAAWQDVVSSDHSVSVAHKDMFPTLRLTGSLGRQSSQLSDLLSGPSIWSIASSLTVPLFNASALRNRMKAAYSRAEQAWVQYLRIALRAFAEVEQALDQEALLAEQEAAQHLAVQRAENAARIFEERYRRGLVSILEYLTAENTVFDLKSRLLSIRNDRLKNRVAMALAFGKGV